MRRAPFPEGALATRARWRRRVRAGAGGEGARRGACSLRGVARGRGRGERTGRPARARGARGWARRRSARPGGRRRRLRARPRASRARGGTLRGAMRARPNSHRGKRTVGVGGGGEVLRAQRGRVRPARQLVSSPVLRGGARERGSATGTARQAGAPVRAGSWQQARSRPFPILACPRDARGAGRGAGCPASHHNHLAILVESVGG